MSELMGKLILVGYTNGSQVKFANESEEDAGGFYSNSDRECYIPLYMLEVHSDRLQATSCDGEFSLEHLIKLQSNKGAK